MALSSTVSDHGRTTGSFAVSASGAATYSIPIWTPPGPNGLEPSLSLSYNSQGGNGLAGVGWNLSAVSSIERCPRTTAQDGADAAIDLSSNDAICLGGNRLRLSTGTYGSAGSVYFTEFADFSRITAVSYAPAGVYFKVEAKSGLIYEYGNSTTSRVSLGGTVLRWMLNKVSDRSGNTYIVTYNNANGFAVPDVISWTPTSHGASTYLYEAQFNYLTTRANADSYLGKVAGFDVTNRYRLEDIQIKSAGVVRRKYVLTYNDTSSITSRSLLTSVQECADEAGNCLLPITFAYQGGLAGVNAGNALTPADSSNSLIKGRYDFNGDGKDDIVYWSSSSWYVALSTGAGFAGPYNTGLTALDAIVDEFLPNGRASFVASIGGSLWSYRWNDASSTFVSANLGISSAAPTTSLDYNGDGLSDLVYFTSGSNTLTVRANTSTGSGNPNFASSASTTAALASPRNYAGLYNYTGKGLYRADVNGDGRQDLNVQIVYTGLGGGATASMILLGSSTGFDLSAEVSGGAPIWPAVNFNGDRCTDRQVNTTILISACSGTAASSVTLPAVPVGLLDWNGDGKTDVLVDNGGTFGVYLSDGAGLSSLITTSLTSSGTFFDLDQDGDGLDDLIRVNGTSAIDYWTHTASGSIPTYATNIPDLLSSVTDGFGVNHISNYVSTAWSNYDKGAVTSSPLEETSPSIVVAQVTSTNGIGGTYIKSYFYLGARRNAERDESAGFQRVDETDDRNNLIRRTYFEQTFPLTGMVSQTELMQPNGTTTISREVFTNNFTPLGTVPNKRYFTFTEGSTATQFEFAGALNSALVRTVVTENTFDTASGTLYDRNVTITEPASGANGVNGGREWHARTYSPLADLMNEPADWCMGQPEVTKQINSHNPAYNDEITRTTNTTWDAAHCRPTQIVDELHSTTLQVTTDLGYDAFGNVNSSIVTGVGMDPRETSSVYSTSGQFPLSVTNAEGEKSTFAWDYDLGVLISAADPNNIGVNWEYDAFGRRTREWRADGTYTVWAIYPCTGCLPTSLKTAVDRYEYAYGGALIGRVFNALDQFDRANDWYVLRNDQLTYNVVQRGYDASGNVAHEYFPYKNNEANAGYSTFTYDLLSRPFETKRPISASNSTLQTTTNFYEGLTTRIVDAQNMVSKRIANAAGELARSEDHNGYFQNFDYDAFGNVNQVVDGPSSLPGAELQSSVYNIRGMLTSRTDMDMGTWNFTPNALGETIEQTDARNQLTTFVFDKLSRLKKRTDDVGGSPIVSEWKWGISSTAKEIGRLKEVTGPGYTENYYYDTVGRLSSTQISADTTYQIGYAYNAAGALDTLTYPASTGTNPLKLKYEYQGGELWKIKECAAPACTTYGTTYWTSNATNARSQITQETLGNGLVTTRAFDAVTGWLKSIQTGSSAAVQNLAYEWDLVGNLKKRKDVNQSNLTEEFFYDNLYRLDYTTLTGQASPYLNLAYDARGNIVEKSDVGTYTYHSTKKHQVVSTNWGLSFSYDANGNMTNRGATTIEWTSFNYPKCIRTGSGCSGSGSSWSKFDYTPDRRYWRQQSNYPSGGEATSIYVGGLLEKVTAGSNTDFRHMIRAGGSTIIVSRKTVGGDSVNYVTSDHLGSSSAITNSSGAPIVNSSFDAFGMRRGADWTGNPSSSDWNAIAATTRRGFTDHSMLDNLELIHMNGRVQDPVLGRFLSADPFIPDPSSTQSFNRYSYVQNNPLRYADPSGFADCDSSGSSNSPSNSTSDDPDKKSDGHKNGGSESQGAAAQCAPNRTDTTDNSDMDEVVVSAKRPANSPERQPPIPDPVPDPNRGTNPPLDPTGQATGGANPIPQSTPPCQGGYRDATPQELAALIDYAKTFGGTAYPSKGMTAQQLSMTVDCADLVARTIRGSVNPSFTDPVPFSTRSAATDPGLRSLARGEAHYSGDVMLFPGHMGFFDSSGPNGSTVWSARGDPERTANLNAGVSYGNPTWWDKTGSNTKWMRVRIPCD